MHKIVNNPEIGKPMCYERKNTREVYFGSLRVSYFYKEDLLIFLNIYRKDEQ